MKKTYKKLISIILTITIFLQSIPIVISAKNISGFSPIIKEENPTSEEVFIVNEDISLRQKYSKHFYMSDKTYLVATYDSPVHYLQNGQWVDIDNSFDEEIDDDEKAVLKNKTNAFEIKFSKKAKKNKLVSVKKDGYKLEWFLNGAEKVTAETFSITGDKDDKTELKNINGYVMYKDILSNADLKYLVTPTGVKECISLNSIDAPSSYSFSYNLNKLSWRKNESGDIELYDEAMPETNVYVIEKAYMFDDNGVYSDNVTMDAVYENGTLLLTLTPNKEWLEDATREFPVIIDPTVRTEQDIESVKTTYFTQKNYDLNALGTIYAGFEKDGKGVVSTAIKFQLPQLSTTDIVLNAKVKLFQTSYSGVNNSINIHKITNAWTPASTAGVQGSPPAYDTRVLDYVIVGTGSSRYFSAWDITSAVKEWYAKPSSNNGVLVKAADETKRGIVRYCNTLNPSHGESAKPVLIIQYMDSKGVNSYQDYTQVASIYKSSFSVNNYTGNLVYSYNDISMPGTRTGISITHYYNSSDYNDADVVSRDFAADANGQKVYYGIGFRTNLNHQLSNKQINDKNYLVHTDADGTKHYFEPNSETNPTKWEYEFDKETFITKNDAGDYCIEYADGSKLVFLDSSRKLHKTIDASGNSLTLEYANDVYYPTAVVDDLNQRTELTYTNNYLTSITDTAGRTTTFAYLDDGRLSTITDAQSRVTQFSYSDGYLTSVTSPEAQKIVFQYESEAPEVGFKKVIKATRYSGTAEGDYLQFAYGDGKTTVTDRQGGSVTSVFDFIGRAVTKYDREMNVLSTKYVESGNQDNDTKKVDTKVAKQFSEKYVDNLLPNGSAEIDGYWGQSNWGTGTYSFSTGFATDYASSGSRSLKVTVNSPMDTCLGRVNALLNLKPGVMYTYSAYVKTQNVSEDSGAILYLAFRNSEGATIGYATSEETVGTSDWKRVSVTFTVPEGTTESRVHCGIRRSSGTAWFDRLQLEEGAVANRYNYIDNGSFENYSSNLPVSWTKGTTFSGGTVEINDRGVRNGHGISIVGTSETRNSYYKQTASVTAKKGQVISFSCWAKANSVSTVGNRNFAIDIGYNYVENGVSKREYIRYSFDDECTDWQHLKNSLIAKGDTSQIDIIILYSNNANTAYFDDFQLFIGEDGQSYEYYTSDDGADLEGKLRYSYNGTKKTQYQYGDSAKNLTKIIYPDTTTEEYTYDSHKRVVSSKDRAGITYAYTYDTWGNLLTTTVGTAPLQTRVTNEYTNGNFLAKTIDINGKATVYNYDTENGTGNLLSVTDPNGNITQYTYYSDDRLHTVTSNGTTVTYTYDVYNLKSISVGNDVVYSFEYDNFNDDVSKIKIGSMTLIEHLYAANNGRLLRSDYGNGTYTEKVYKNDWSNTVTGVKYNGTEAYQYAYDNTNTVGIHTDNENGDTYHYEYDERGRLIGVVSSEDYNTRMTFTEYDEPLRSEINVQVSGAYAEKYGKNKTWYTEISYNNKRQVSTANFGYGKKNYSYDALGRTTGAAIRDNCNSSSDILTESVVYNTNADGTTSTQVGSYTMAGTTYGYTYDSNGNILTISKNGALAESYVYDGLNQLVRENSVTQNKTIVYTYDNGGNILSKTEYPYTLGEPAQATNTVNYTYGDTNWKDLMTGYNGTAITYDGIGNPITYRNGISFTWKNGRRLASYTDGVYNITYNYTDGGIRKNKTVNGETTEYLLSGSQIMQERRPNGDILNYARDESGGLVGFDYYSAAENVINFYYYLKNMQGDIVGITDRQGNVLVTYTYDTWGKLISITGSMANTIGIINPFRYRGYYYDTETGFYYVSRRYYDPEIGRWLNADGQISGVGGEVLGYNMFAYCMNNPVNMSDPSGNWPRWITAAVTVVAAVVTVAAVATGNFVVAAVAATVTIAAGAAYIAQSAHYDRREAKNDVATLPKSPSDATKAGWINSNPKSDLNPNGGGPKATLHQYTSTNNSNVKYVSPDGHREVIYNSKNEIVLDARDSGTYNFCPSDKFWYSNASIGHLFHEIIPWVIFGNSDDDPGPIINQIICLFE